MAISRSPVSILYCSKFLAFSFGQNLILLILIKNRPFKEILAIVIIGIPSVAYPPELNANHLKFLQDRLEDTTSQSNEISICFLNLLCLLVIPRDIKSSITDLRVSN